MDGERKRGARVAPLELLSLRLEVYGRGGVVGRVCGGHAAPCFELLSCALSLN